MTDKLDFIRAELARRRETKTFINIPAMESPADGWMVVNGKRVLNFSTNNYLGLANHPIVKQKAQAAKLLSERQAATHKKMRIQQILNRTGTFVVMLSDL